MLSFFYWFCQQIFTRSVWLEWFMLSCRMFFNIFCLNLWNNSKREANLLFVAFCLPCNWNKMYKRAERGQRWAEKPSRHYTECCFLFRPHKNPKNLQETENSPNSWLLETFIRVIVSKSSKSVDESVSCTLKQRLHEEERISPVNRSAPSEVNSVRDYFYITIRHSWDGWVTRRLLASSL